MVRVRIAYKSLPLLILFHWFLHAVHLKNCVIGSSALRVWTNRKYATSWAHFDIDCASCRRFSTRRRPPRRRRRAFCVASARRFSTRTCRGSRVRVWAGFTRQTQPAAVVVVVAVVVPNDGLPRFGKKSSPPRLDGEHAPAGWTKRQHGGGGGGGGVFSSSTFTNTAVAVASPVPSSFTGVNDDGDGDDFDVVVVLLN